MNLVIDDAVEVQLATRDGPEKRRQLGALRSIGVLENAANVDQVKYYSRATMFH